MAPYNIRDTQLKDTKALPNGAAAVNSTGFDLGHNPTGEFLAPVELLLTAPALTTTEQPDGKTMKYDLQSASDAAFTSPTTHVTAAITQTGAGGAGAAGQTYRWRPPTNVGRYVRFKATGSAAGNSTTASATLEILA